jgi:CRP-like cAMP-binding protein
MPSSPLHDEHATSARGWSNLLGEVPLFANLGPRRLRKVAALATIRRFHTQTAIVRADETGNTLFVVLDGEVSVKRPGQPQLQLARGSFFGEMALLDGGARSATVIADGPVTCLTITQSRFLKLLRNEPSVAIALLKELATRLRDDRAF